MGNVARSPLFRSHQTEPLSTVLINANGNPIEYVNVIADTANIYPGLLVYISATSYSNEVTECPANYGDISTEGLPLLVEIPASHQNFTGNYEKDTAFPDGASFKALRLYKGMDVWLKGSSLTAAQVELLVHAASGLVTNTGDPDGAAIDQSSFAYTALTALTSGTWIPGTVEGKVTFDKTA